MTSLDEVYSLNYDVKSFAVSNRFVTDTNKACYQLGKNLVPFCIFGNEEQKSRGIMDFAEFTAFVDSSKSLIDEICSYRYDVYKDFGISVDLSDINKKKLLFFDYLLSISACYIEIPKYVTKNGMHLKTFDKYLCTKNPAIMATWMGSTTNEMQVKYSSRITSRQVEFNINETRFVRLNHTKKGNSITVPRNASSIENMRCIPLYMLYAFTEGFKTVINEKIVKFEYLKDNGTIRELDTTLNETILMDYYKDNIFVSTMLQGVDINSVKQGGMYLSSHINRGYIKVPELGASKYDETGVRSLNIARILSLKVIPEVDRSFINVDLKSVLYNFDNALDYIATKDSSCLKDIYKALTDENIEGDTSSILMAIKQYASDRCSLLSTTFQRMLHTFMIKNPLWFPLYTGERDESQVSLSNNSTSIGVEEAEYMDF